MFNEAFASWLIPKIATWLSSVFGGLSVSLFWLPKKLQEHGKMIAGVMVAMISGAAGIVFTPFILSKFGLDVLNMDDTMMVSFLVGMFAVATVGAVAAFFAKSEGKDIVTIIQEVKNDVK